MSKTSMSRRVLLSSAGALGLAAVAGSGAIGQTAAGDYAVVEGAVASLAGVKRVIITNFVCAFQLDGAVRKDNATRIGNLTLGGGNAREVAAQMVWQNPDGAELQAIADAGLAALKADLRAKGIEVLDEALLATQPAYANILTATGMPNQGTYTVLNISDNTGTTPSMTSTITAWSRWSAPRACRPTTCRPSRAAPAAISTARPTPPRPPITSPAGRLIWPRPWTAWWSRPGSSSTSPRSLVEWSAMAGPGASAARRWSSRRRPSPPCGSARKRPACPSACLPAPTPNGWCAPWAQGRRRHRHPGPAGPGGKPVL